MVLLEPTEAFNNVLQDFGYTQKLETYNPFQHQVHSPQKFLYFNNNKSTYTFSHSLNTSFNQFFIALDDAVRCRR